MQIVFNELSLLPLAATTKHAEQRLLLFLQTFRELRTKFGFNHILFPQHYSLYKITPDFNLIEFVTNLQPTIKSLLLSLMKSPYLDDLNKEEINIFFESKYEIIDDGCPTKEQPFGLPIARIKDVPVLSLDSHLFWSNKTITVAKINDNGAIDGTFYVHNITSPDDVYADGIATWYSNYGGKNLDSHEDLSRFLAFAKYEVSFSDQYLEQLKAWRDSQFKKYSEILVLMKDVEFHPFTGGIGKTESLRYIEKGASKRITLSDRLCYSVSDNTVHFISCRGHYE